MKRRGFIKLLGLVPFIGIGESKPKFVRKVEPGESAFRVGDIVRYVKIAKRSFGYKEEESYSWEIKRQTPFLGTLMVIRKVSSIHGRHSYSIDGFKGAKVPFNAWHNEDSLELVKAIDEFHEEV